MVNLIVEILVLGLVYWLVSLLPIPAPFNMIVKVVFVIIAILLILSAFGIYNGISIR